MMVDLSQLKRVTAFLKAEQLPDAAFLVKELAKELEAARALIDLYREAQKHNHRNWDHSAGCPSCDAWRAIGPASEAYDKARGKGPGNER